MPAAWRTGAIVAATLAAALLISLVFVSLEAARPRELRRVDPTLHGAAEALIEASSYRPVEAAQLNAMLPQLEAELGVPLNSLRRAAAQSGKVPLHPPAVPLPPPPPGTLPGWLGVGVLLHNSAAFVQAWLGPALRWLAAAAPPGARLHVTLWENDSRDGTPAALAALCRSGDPEAQSEPAALLPAAAQAETASELAAVLRTGPGAAVKGPPGTLLGTRHTAVWREAAAAQVHIEAFCLSGSAAADVAGLLAPSRFSRLGMYRELVRGRQAVAWQAAAAPTDAAVLLLDDAEWHDIRWVPAAAAALAAPPRCLTGCAAPVFGVAAQAINSGACSYRDTIAAVDVSEPWPTLPPNPTAVQLRRLLAWRSPAAVSERVRSAFNGATLYAAGTYLAALPRDARLYPRHSAVCEHLPAHATLEAATPGAPEAGGGMLMLPGWLSLQVRACPALPRPALEPIRPHAFARTPSPRCAAVTGGTLHKPRTRTVPCQREHSSE